MKVHELECDGCGARKNVNSSEGRPWVTVTNSVSHAEYLALAESFNAGVDVESALDQGDFCSLHCLANWASARANLRGLDEPVEAGD